MKGAQLGRFDVAPILEGYRHIVAATETHGVRRLVALGTPSITDAADRREPALSILVVAGKRFKPAAYQTMVDIGQIVCASELDWTIVRVPLLTDGPRTERINVGTLGDKDRYPTLPRQRRRLLPPTDPGHHPGRSGPAHHRHQASGAFAPNAASRRPKPTPLAAGPV
jgi:hypothetical protein